MTVLRVGKEKRRVRGGGGGGGGGERKEKGREKNCQYRIQSNYSDTLAKCSL